MIKNTGVRVSKEDFDIAHQRANGVVTAPVIKVHGKWIPEQERLAFGEWLDALAKNYGLPAPERNTDGEVVHYGMTADGEFTRWVGDADDCPDQDILGQ